MGGIFPVFGSGRVPEGNKEDKDIDVDQANSSPVEKSSGDDSGSDQARQADGPIGSAILGPSFIVAPSSPSSKPIAALTDEIHIGRLENSARSIIINDENISRNHLSLWATKDGLVVRDNGSSNGTWLVKRGKGRDLAAGAEQITQDNPRYLYQGDVLNLGNYQDPATKLTVCGPGVFKITKPGMDSKYYELSNNQVNHYLPYRAKVISQARDGKFVFGKFQLHSHNISDKHFEISLNPLSVKDLGSTNGTKLVQLNGSEVKLVKDQAHALHPGEKIKASGFEIKYIGDYDFSVNGEPHSIRKDEAGNIVFYPCDMDFSFWSEREFKESIFALIDLYSLSRTSTRNQKKCVGLFQYHYSYAGSEQKAYIKNLLATDEYRSSYFDALRKVCS